MFKKVPTGNLSQQDPPTTKYLVKALCIRSQRNVTGHIILEATDGIVAIIITYLIQPKDGISF